MLPYQKILQFIYGIAIVGLILFSIRDKQNKVVYVSSKAVFEGFKMTQETQKLAEAEGTARQQHLDSLFYVLKISEDPKIRHQLQVAIAEEKQYLDNFQFSFSSAETPKIWARISDYAKDFSEKNSYRFILGAQPGGNVLYGDPDNDVTKEFLEFINNRYEGN